MVERVRVAVVALRLAFISTDPVPFAPDCPVTKYRLTITCANTIRLAATF